MFDLFARIPGLSSLTSFGVGPIGGSHFALLSTLTTNLVGSPTLGGFRSEAPPVNVAAGLSGYLGSPQAATTSTAAEQDFASAASGPIAGTLTEYQANWKNSEAVGNWKMPASWSTDLFGSATSYSPGGAWPDWTSGLLAWENGALKPAADQPVPTSLNDAEQGQGNNGVGNAGGNNNTGDTTGPGNNGNGNATGNPNNGNNGNDGSNGNAGGNGSNNGGGGVPWIPVPYPNPPVIVMPGPNPGVVMPTPSPVVTQPEPQLRYTWMMKAPALVGCDSMPGMPMTGLGGIFLFNYSYSSFSA